MLKVPSAVGVFSASVPEFDFELSACEVAVTVTVAGNPGASVGAVYKPLLASIVPFAAPPVTAHVTVWFVELFTVAVNCAVCEGQPF